MPPDIIDDLFRQQLGGHATPPGDELQRRLDALAADERLDALFRTGLATHATPPHRELWERFEDEHLHPQPRRRRVVAWWQYSAAAVLLVLLLAGGGRLWRGHPGGGEVATTTHTTGPLTSPKRATPTATANTGNSQQHIGLSSQTTGQQIFATTPTGAVKKTQQNFSAQATETRASPSSSPIASTTRPRHPATARQLASQLRTQSQQSDAGTNPLAGPSGQTTPTGLQSKFPLATANTTVAPAIPGNEPATLALATTGPPASPEIIEVEVRRGQAPSPASPAQPVAVAAAEPVATRQPRLRLRGLLRQADHLMHGEPVSLAEATGLPETVTVQARLGSRTLSRTIQL